MTEHNDGGGVELMLKAFIDFGDKTEKHFSKLQKSIEPRGIFKTLVQAATVPGASSQIAVDMGTPTKDRMWMVRELMVFESGNPYSEPGPTQATATGAAGAAVNATLSFFTPYMQGFDVEIEPSTAAGLAVITVTGAGLPTLTYYLEESTTANVSKSIRYPGIGISQTEVSVSAVTSGGIVSVNVYGVKTGSPANVGWYVGGTDQPQATNAPVQTSLRWLQGQATEQSALFMPFESTFGNRVFPVTAPDHLIGFVQSAIGGENFVLLAVVEEFSIPAIESMTA
jgi:hypothetical protein